MHYFVKPELTQIDLEQPKLAMSKLRLLNYTLHYTATKNIAKALILSKDFQPIDAVKPNI